MPVPCFYLLLLTFFFLRPSMHAPFPYMSRLFISNWSFHKVKVFSSSLIKRSDSSHQTKLILERKMRCFHLALLVASIGKALFTLVLCESDQYECKLISNMFLQVLPRRQPASICIRKFHRVTCL